MELSGQLPATTAYCPGKRLQYRQNDMLGGAPEPTSNAEYPQKIVRRKYSYMCFTFLCKSHFSPGDTATNIKNPPLPQQYAQRSLLANNCTRDLTCPHGVLEEQGLLGYGTTTLCWFLPTFRTNVHLQASRNQKRLGQHTSVHSGS